MMQPSVKSCLSSTRPTCLGLVGQQVAEGILRVREGYFKITPGYDGVWGQLDIFEERETAELMQMRLF